MRPTLIRAAAMALLAWAAANAGIILVSGDFQVKPSSTASYLADAYNDRNPAPMRIWTEQAGIRLSQSVVLDTDLANPLKRYFAGGASAGNFNFVAGGGPTLLQGTPVSVYYAYFDPLNDSAQGSVTFDTPILGIVAYTGQLQYSDFLRVPGAPYPIGNPAFAARGWESGGEWGQIGVSRRTFTWSANASSPGDQFRIFVAIPEPGTYAMMGAGLLSLWLLRRRR